MLFELPEYDDAFTQFLYTSVNALARSQNPLLAGIREEVVESGGSSVVDSRTEERLDLSSESVGFEMSWDREAVVKGDFEALIVQLDSAAHELAEKLIGEPSRLLRRPRSEDFVSSREENLRECQPKGNTPTS